MNISITDFTQCTATELTDLYRTGSVSPVTVAEQVLAKIARVNPVLNAFCFTDPATTLKQAELSKQRWRQGHQLLSKTQYSLKDGPQGMPVMLWKPISLGPKMRPQWHDYAKQVQFLWAKPQ